MFHNLWDINVLHVSESAKHSGKYLAVRGVKQFMSFRILLHEKQIHNLKAVEYEKISKTDSIVTGMFVCMYVYSQDSKISVSY